MSNTGFVHREIYELFVGPIPDGLDIDHLCGNKGCINPEHLEPVTRSENVRRAIKRIGQWGGKQPFNRDCPRGHPLVPLNRVGKTYQQCRYCMYVRNARNQRHVKTFEEYMTMRRSGE